MRALIAMSGADVSTPVGYVPVELRTSRLDLAPSHATRQSCPKNPIAIGVFIQFALSGYALFSEERELSIASEHIEGFEAEYIGEPTYKDRIIALMETPFPQD
ncbi:hypothetical protein IU449_06760 [Nocardia higoensis]|uniref:Uncharacterized protein n=1 Tax=Nocardia higoensis TaxID=228599 RepID=A0ABS0D9C3_9NOCA|nr:hypothetical protein [Nocardia higoensis]MBF6354242.1 hypothetical protein [Nocardia higoensis]